MNGGHISIAIRLAVGDLGLCLQLALDLQAEHATEVSLDLEGYLQRFLQLCRHFGFGL